MNQTRPGDYEVDDIASATYSEARGETGKPEEEVARTDAVEDDPAGRVPSTTGAVVDVPDIVLAEGAGAAVAALEIVGALVAETVTTLT